MRHLVPATFLLGALAGCAVQATTTAPPTVEPVEVGQAAPDFTLKDLQGNEHSLSAHKGKTVVLEWFNPGCPFVVDTHGAGGALETLGAEAVKDGVVWLAINSGAEGKQGHGVTVNAKAVADWSMGYPVLLDPTGEVGKSYGAITTPHMYVIDAEGVLRYAGGIDNAPMRKASGARVPFVENALADLAAGREVATPRTKPYGCSVKYR